MWVHGLSGYLIPLDTVRVFVHVCVCVFARASLSSRGCEEMYSEMQMLKIVSEYAESRKRRRRKNNGSCMF